MLDFGLPWMFLLLPLPWLVHRFLPAANRHEAALTMPFFDHLPILAQSEDQPRSRLRAIILAAAWLCFLSAAAQPFWIGDAVELPTSGRNLMLAVDISGSMQVEDMVLNGRPANRLHAVKKVVGEFVQRRGGDRLGLILFGSKAYLQTPLTFDRNTMYTLLLEAQIGFAGEKTAIGDAIGLAIKRLQGNEQHSRVVVLLTDGANTSGEVPPRQAAELAAEAGVRIYTIGMGAESMRTGGVLGFGSREVNPSRDLDEKTLGHIASLTGGQYFRARNVQELETIYAELDRLEPIEQAALSFRPRKSLFHLPLSASLALVFLLFAGIQLRGRYAA